LTAALLLAITLPLSIDVAWGDRASGGSETLRADIERQIASAVAGAGCFTTLAPKGTERAPVRLQVSLDDYREETNFDDSLATYAQAQEPGQGLRLEAVFSVIVRLRIFAGESDVPFREKKFRVLREIRPRIPGDDPVAIARDEAIEAIGEETARAVCKVAGPKLEAAAGAR
jgi:hypothetical protein